MNKSKSVFLTVLFMAMLTMIIIGLRILQSPAFGVAALAFGAYGAVHFSLDFYRWLRRDYLEEVSPADFTTFKVKKLTKKDLEDIGGTYSFGGTYDEIRQEVQAENG